MCKLAVRSREEDLLNDKGTRRFTAPSVGLFAPGTHEVAENTSISIAHHASINMAVGIIREAIKSQAVYGYVEGTGGTSEQETASESGFLRYLLLSVQRSSARVQLTLVW